MNGLEVSQDIFIASRYESFARYLEILSNPTNESLEVRVACFGDLGSDELTEIVMTSSGDARTTVDHSLYIVRSIKGCIEKKTGSFPIPLRWHATPRSSILRDLLTTRAARSAGREEMIVPIQDSDHNLESVLHEQFGHSEFLPGQREVIEFLLEGRSTAVVFPTGGGKSLCYQLPALLIDGLTIVVSPLIALMKDQIDSLTRRGIEAARLDSSLSFDESRGIMDSVRGGRLRLLYVAPERFNNERFRDSIRRVPIGCFAVDEAHCISEWGHNFRPDYLKLAEFSRECGAERVLALTATATPGVLDDICNAFKITPDCAIRTKFFRSNLSLRSTSVTPETRDELLLERIRSRPAASTIVYVTLQKTAERIAKFLALQDVPARAYHAGMAAEVRAEVQDEFMNSDHAVVVATIAFGMGIDKSDIRYVYHYNLPKSLENYAQEVGRAGRDGEPATCEMLVCMDDLNVLENFALGDTPTREGIEELIRLIFSDEEHFDVSISELSSKSDIRVLVVRTLLTYLELDGFLRGGTPFYSKYRFQLLRTTEEILSKFDERRREFLSAMFRCGAKARTWITIDVDEAATKIGSTRDRLVRALDYMSEQEMIVLAVAGVRHRYSCLRRPDDQSQLAAALFERMIDRERREIERLGQVVEWAAEDGCQAAVLSEHFGESLDEPCGHCSWCDDEIEPFELPDRPSAEPDEAVLREAERVREEHPEVLGDPRTMARFLCGITSPGLRRAKLTRHESFGALSRVAFKLLLARAQESSGG